MLPTTPTLLPPRLPSWRKSTKCVGFSGQSSWWRSTSSVRKSCSGRTAPESAAHVGPNTKAALSTNHASASTTTKLLQEVYTVGHYPFNSQLCQFSHNAFFSREGHLHPFSEINPSPYKRTSHISPELAPFDNSSFLGFSWALSPFSMKIHFLITSFPFAVLFSLLLLHTSMNVDLDLDLKVEEIQYDPLSNKASVLF